MMFENDVVTFNQESIMVIFPNVPHFFHSDEKRGVTLIQLEFLISNLERFFDNLHPYNSLSFILNLKTNSWKYMKFYFSHSIKDCLERIIQEETNNEENADDLKELYYRELIVLLSRQINKRLNIYTGIENQYLKTALDIIHDNYLSGQLHLNEIACKCNISPRYLRILFKKHLQTGPADFINQLKINKAKKMLLDNDYKSIKEMAYQAGYTSPQHFSTVFKKLTGFTPLNFKKEYFRKT